MTSPGLDALRRAVAAAPDDVALRVHLAEQLLAAGDPRGALEHTAAALAREPDDQAALLLMARLVAPPGTDTGTPAREVDGAPAAEDAGEFDWDSAEADLGHVRMERFVEPAGPAAPLGDLSDTDVESPGITLDDVGGMGPVKERLQAAFLAPMRNPELRKLYGKSLRGGLLLYGPPGCGKTFLARALAGELGAKFLAVSIADVLDPYIGNSEQNVRDIFGTARRNAPFVLFLDEFDALGGRRSATPHSYLRGTSNQLLIELDGVRGDNEGVFVLAATNQPWDVDPALRRPGRLDRTVFVPPPDAEARAAIFRHHLAERPIESIDLGKLAARTEGFSGADIAYCCELATERALMDGVRTGTTRLITMSDFDAALTELRPSIGAWLDSARNVVLFADSDGTYRELRDYLKRVKRL